MTRRPPQNPSQAPRTLREIFDEYAPFVWRSLRYLGVRESDVHDVSQDVFLVVHRRYGDFEGRSSLRTWIYGICLRTAKAYHRRAHRRYEQLDDSPPDEGVGAEQGLHVDRARLRDQLQRGLDQLDEGKREVFVLHDIEELPMTEVAEILGCHLQTAYWRLRKARSALRAYLSREEGNE